MADTETDIWRVPEELGSEVSKQHEKHNVQEPSSILIKRNKIWYVYLMSVNYKKL